MNISTTVSLYPPINIFMYTKQNEHYINAICQYDDKLDDIEKSAFPDT